jgi:hypothetical protein
MQRRQAGYERLPSWGVSSRVEQPVEDAQLFDARRFDDIRQGAGIGFIDGRSKAGLKLSLVDGDFGSFTGSGGLSEGAGASELIIEAGRQIGHALLHFWSDFRMQEGLRWAGGKQQDRHRVLRLRLGARLVFGFDEGGQSWGALPFGQDQAADGL